MARRKKKQKEPETSGGWLNTFSDLMTLLLTFFVLLFSMSSVSSEKFSAVTQSLNSAFSKGGGSILDGGAINPATVPDNEAANDVLEGADQPVPVPQEIIDMYEEAVQVIEEQGVESDVSVSYNQQGVYMDIQESILFDSGRADITESGEETLDVMADLLAVTDNEIVIEGYTDNVPSTTARFPSNWELSTARAVTVVRYLAEEQGIAPSRLSAKGYGEFSPSVPNDSPENRAKNRRVNIVIVYEPEEANPE